MIPYFFDFNVPAVFVDDKRPDLMLKVKVAIHQLDNGQVITQSFLQEVEGWSICRITNWIAVNGLIDRAATSHVERILKPQLKAAS